MKTYSFSDLFEDEVAEVIRSAGHRSRIACGLFSWAPACMMCEDGIYTSGTGYMVEYIQGRRTAYVGIGSVIRRLAHEYFTVTVFEEE